ncbi:whirlin-like [Bacillus rossius redtenbacheri]|uniref:whirlin-like n=1 Tax=Bacillus rossius redtenbacheri TaxID=93214 RepID=UPI002FDD77B2
MLYYKEWPLEVPGCAVEEVVVVIKGRPVWQVLRLLSDGRLPTPHHPGPAGSPSSAHLQARELPPNLHQDLLVRTVTMTRPPDSGHGFGICVKGGKDSGVGVYISRVEEGSIAERVGLRPGDTILEVNGTPFSGISHEEALKMLKSCRQLSMTVKSPNLPPPPPPPPPPMERPQPASPWLVRQAYSWIDRQGRPVSPPPEYARASPPPPPPPNPRYYCRPGKDKGVRKVELNIEPGQSLGLMIRGGVEYNLGIFITGVDKDSVADRAGLMIGDQILEVNGQSFLEVTHDEAVNQLKFHKRMALLVRDVGKVPHSCTAYDDLPWEAHSPGGARQQRSPALQMVEEKARVVLSKVEFATLAYYQEEYATGQMTVEAFLAVLLELLHTPEKYTLLTEIRELVAPEDRARFDELVYRREAEGQRCRELRDLLGQREQERHQHPAPRPASASAAATAARPCDLPQGGLSCDPYREPEEFRTPSEDSGVCLGPEPPAPARCARAGGGVAADWPSSPASSHLDKRTSDLALSNDEDLDSCHQEYGGGGGGGGGGRRHSSPGGSRRASGAGLDASAYAADANMVETD